MDKNKVKNKGIIDFRNLPLTYSFEEDKESKGMLMHSNSGVTLTYEEMKELIDKVQIFLDYYGKDYINLLHEHHYPITKNNGGTQTVGICATCHYEFHYMKKYITTSETICCFIYSFFFKNFNDLIIVLL